jgi:hypothetical protein
VQKLSGNSGHGEGLTPLFRAAVAGQSRVVAALLARGADPNYPAVRQSLPEHMHVRGCICVRGCLPAPVSTTCGGVRV